MAVIDQDNFSNISWHSDRPGAVPAGYASQSQSGRDAEGASDAEPVERRLPEPEPNYNRMDAHGLGDEVLECTVSSPIKENDGTKDAFVSYLITTHTTFPGFQKPDVSVRRRFTDFVFLFKTLSRDYPACAVPPLPDKQRMEYVRGDRFGTDFTVRRAHSLRRFLARCALHPVLRRSSILHTFLESPDWNATMRSRASRSVSMSGTSSGESTTGGYTSVTSPGGSTASNMANSVFDNFADTFINAFTKVHKPDRRFIEVREKSDKLDEDLSHVEKVVARVSRRETDLEADLKDLAEQFQKLIVLEPGVESPVRAFAASVEDTAQRLRSLKDATDQDYLGSLRDLAAFSGALKNLLKAREQKQLDFEQLTEYLNKSSAERDSLAGGGYGSYGGGGALAGAGGFIRSKIEDVRGVDHEQSRRERQRKLELRIEELTIEVERAKRTSEMFDEEVVKEVADFERIKRVEIKRQFGALAQSHTDFYDATIDVWERYIEEMEKDGAVAA